MISEEISKKSAMGMTQPANDVVSPSHSPVIDSFLESAPVHEQEMIHLQPYTKGLSVPCSTEKYQNTVITELHCIDANLYEDEETSAFTADSQGHEKMDNGDRVIVEKDDGKDGDVGKFLCGVQKSIVTATERLAGGKINQTDKERSINTALTGVEKDLGKNKDLRAVLSDVENYRDRAEDMCTVFGNDIITVLSGVDMDLGKHTESDQYETEYYEDEETTELNYLLLQPPEEFRWDESKDEELDTEEMARRWHSARAVMLLLRDELQQMHDFIDRLRISRTPYKLDIETSILEEALSVDDQVQHCQDGLGNMEEALRLVCDRLDVLIIVCDAGLDDCNPMFAAEASDGLGYLTSSEIIKVEETESTIEEGNSDEQCARFQTENRQLFDRIVDMMRQSENGDIRHSLQDLETVDDCFQTQQIEQHTQSNEHEEEPTLASDSTEANSSYESSYTTCDGCSSDGTSPIVSVYQSAFEEVSTDFTSTAKEEQLLGDPTVAGEDTEMAKREINTSSQLQGSITEDGGSLYNDEQTDALPLLHNSKALLHLQKKSNAMLNHELVQLSYENTKLQGIISNLRTSLDLKNDEVLTLTNKVDNFSRLLDEQVEEFRCVFRAVSREYDEEIHRLTEENNKLKSALEDLNTNEGFCEKEPTVKKLPVQNTSAHGDDSYEVMPVQENSTWATMEQLRTDDGLSTGKSGGIRKEAENTQLEKNIPPQADCADESADRVVSVHCVYDLWSEIDALKKMLPKEHPYMGDRQYVHPDGDLNDSGVSTHSNSNDQAAVDEKGICLQLAHLPVDADDQFCCAQSLHPPVMPTHSASTALQPEVDLQIRREETRSDGKLTDKPVFELPSSKNVVDVFRRTNLQNTSSKVVDKLKDSHLPDVKVSWQTRNNSLSRTLSDSCLLTKVYVNGVHDHPDLRTGTCDSDYSGGKCELFRTRHCLGNCFQFRCPKQGRDVRNVTTQTRWPEPNADVRKAEAVSEENEVEMSEDAFKVSEGKIMEVYSSLKSELQCFRNIMVCDDFDIVHKHKVEDFCSSDMQCIMANFKQHVEQKMILGGENRLLVEEVGRLLFELLKSGRSNLPVIQEEFGIGVDSVFDEEEVEQRDLCSPGCTFEQQNEYLGLHHSKDFKYQLVGCTTDENTAVEMDFDLRQLRSTSSLADTTRPASKCESDSIRSALYGSFDDVKIITGASSTPNKEKPLNNGKMVGTKFQQKNQDFELLLQDPDPSFVSTSVRNSSLELTVDSQQPSLADLVVQLRKQNSRLAYFLSVANSLFLRRDYHRTSDHADHQLQTTVFGQSGFADLEKHTDSSVHDSPMFLPIQSSPFIALSVVCLERPLVVDLTTITSLGVIGLHRKLQLRCLKQ